MKEQRYLPALRAHIEQLLDEGWVIATRAPSNCATGGKAAWCATAC